MCKAKKQLFRMVSNKKKLVALSIQQVLFNFLIKSHCSSSSVLLSPTHCLILDSGEDFSGTYPQEQYTHATVGCFRGSWKIKVRRLKAVVIRLCQLPPLWRLSLQNQVSCTFTSYNKLIIPLRNKEALELFNLSMALCFLYLFME